MSSDFLNMKSMVEVARCYNKWRSGSLSVREREQAQSQVRRLCKNNMYYSANRFL